MGHSRFQRWAPGEDPCRLQARDRQVLTSVYRFRYLTAEQIGFLHFEDRAPKVVRLRLRKLWNAQLLDRIWLPYVLETGNGGKGLIGPIYRLGPKGIAVVAEAMDLPRGDLLLPKRGRKVSALTLGHDLEVIRFLVGLVVAVRELGPSYSLHWELDASLRGRVALFRRLNAARLARFTLRVPDAVVLMATEEGTTALFLVELDTGTEPHARIIAKTEGYLRLHARGILREMLGAPVSGVLYLTGSEQRAAFLRHSFARVTDHPFFWVASYRAEDVHPARVLDLDWSGAVPVPPLRLGTILEPKESTTTI